MKRVLIEGMTENLGGIETYVHLLFQVLKREYQVDFITVDEKIPFEQEFLNAGGQIHRITPRYKSVKRFCKDIDRIFSENPYDVFWFNKTTISSIYSIKSAKKHGVKKVVVHSHSSKNMGNALTMVMHTFNMHRVSRYMDVKAACSQVAADWFFGKKTEDVVIFPNAVDVSLYEPDADKQQVMKKELNLEGKFVIGNAARFCPEKNHKLLIDIFEQVLKQEPDARLVLCGTGDLMETTRQQVKEKHMEEQVLFLGARKDMPRVYQAMDLFLMPSLFEGLPFTLVEAQASGIPCVVSDTVSREAALTDIIDYVPLDAELKIWADQILSHRGYQKISKKEQLTEKGFTVEAFTNTVFKILA